MNHMTHGTQEEPQPLIECPDCYGLGKLIISECCNAELIKGICPDCRELSDGEDCEKCIGTGKVEADQPGDH